MKGKGAIGEDLFLGVITECSFRYEGLSQRPSRSPGKRPRHSILPAMLFQGSFKGVLKERSVVLFLFLLVGLFFPAALIFLPFPPAFTFVGGRVGGLRCFVLDRRSRGALGMLVLMRYRRGWLQWLVLLSRRLSGVIGLLRGAFWGVDVLLLLFGRRTRLHN